MGRKDVDVLVQFARVVSDAAESSEIFPLLADAIVEQVGCDGVAIVGIGAAGRATIAVTRGVPDVVKNLALDADAIGEELGEAVLAACKPTFAVEHTRPLVAGGSLFGAVVMLCEKGKEPTAAGLQLAEALIDLGAIARASAVQVEMLERSYAELRASQDLLTRSEKLRALGQMAAGVSHDLKNILNPLSLHLQVMDRALAKGDSAGARESIPEMKQVVVRGVQTLDRLRDYSRQQAESKTELVDLDHLAREAAKLAAPRMATSAKGRVLKIEEELTGPPQVMVISGEVVSALVNLVVNAIDALGATGKGTKITLRSGEIDGGSFVEVADDGPGMPPEIEKRVFEPFFTTKGAEGTGLGLANVYAAMQRHGGSIALVTSPGNGTCFRLWFPGAPLSR